MSGEPVVYRDEVLIIMWLIGDLARAARRFVELLEGDDGEEEETEDD
jgi:hypothetical protein